MFYPYMDRLAKVYVRVHVTLFSGIPPSHSERFDNVVRYNASMQFHTLDLPEDGFASSSQQRQI